MQHLNPRVVRIGEILRCSWICIGWRHCISSGPDKPFSQQHRFGVWGPSGYLDPPPAGAHWCRFL